MPIVQTSPVTTKIFDLGAEVILKVENRTSDLNRAYVWIQEAIKEIAHNTDFRNDFDQLEVLGPTFDLSINVSEYDESNIIPPGELLLSTLNISVWIDPPTNATRRKLRPGHFQESDKFVTSTPSQPTFWYRFGSNIGFFPVPDKTYQIQARVLKEHPFNDADVKSTNILLPKDWNEIICWSAAMRGFMELLEYEKAEKIKILLHGDPKYPERPGLMYGRKKRHEREDWRQQKTLRPVVRRYGWGAP